MAEGESRQLTRRRFLELAMGAGLAVPLGGSLASCSSSNSGALGGGSNKSGKVTELIVPVNTSPWLDAYKKAAAAYQSESGVKVTLREFPYGGLRTAMVNAIHGGNHPFDIYHLDEPWTGEFYSNGWCTPFDQVDTSYQLDPQIIDYNNLPRWDATNKRSSADGKVMGLPLNGNVNVFVYRKDLYQQLGLSVPTTFDQAYSNGRTSMSRGKTKYGYVARAQPTQGGQSITYDFMPLLYSYGGGWFDDKWNPIVDNAGSIAAMNEFKKLLSLGPPQPQTVGQADVIAAMQGGQTLQVHTVAAAAPGFLDPSKSTVADKVGFAIMPAGSTGKPTPTSGVWSLTIPDGLAKSRQQAALKFITWILSSKGQEIFAKAGGIPTRKDTYQSGAVPASAQAYMRVVLQSAQVARQSVRYPFSAAMLPVAEQTLANEASGATPVKEGMDSLANQLRSIATKAGFGT